MYDSTHHLKIILKDREYIQEIEKPPCDTSSTCVSKSWNFGKAHFNAKYVCYCTIKPVFIQSHAITLVLVYQQFPLSPTWRHNSREGKSTMPTSSCTAPYEAGRLWHLHLDLGPHLDRKIWWLWIYSMGSLNGQIIVDTLLSSGMLVL